MSKADKILNTDEAFDKKKAAKLMNEAADKFFEAKGLVAKDKSMWKIIGDRFTTASEAINNIKAELK